MIESLPVMLADSLAEQAWWFNQMLAWSAWGLVCGAIGLFVAKFLWEGKRERAEEMEKVNRQLRREHEELLKQTKKLG